MKLLGHIYPRNTEANTVSQFQEINVISMPTRTDKQDALIVQAALSGFKINIADGVDATKIPPKALPYTMDQKTNIVGTWRAHLNVLRDMVARRVSSALIFEDDVDWDVSIKAQLVEFARGSRYVLGSGTNNPHSPYGDGWDMLWIGHCSATEDPRNNRRWVIPGDPTVVPFHARGGIDKPDMSPWDNTTRIVFAANNGCCMISYGLSLRGAEKALYHFSMLPYNAPIDWGFSDACRDRKSGFTCISPYPTLTGTYRPAGNASKYSDVETEGDSDKTIVETGYTEKLMFSARMNIDRLLTGQTAFKSEFSDLSGEEMRIENIGSASGHPELAAGIVDD